MSDSPYLMQLPDRDELWLVDGEQRFLITPKIYDLLASNGADLPPAYGIEKLREQNARLRKLVRDMMRFFEDGDWCDKCNHARECDSQEQYEDDCLMRLVFRDRMAQLEVDE